MIGKRKQKKIEIIVVKYITSCYRAGSGKSKSFSIIVYFVFCILFLCSPKKFVSCPLKLYSFRFHKINFQAWLKAILPVR